MGNESSKNEASSLQVQFLNLIKRQIPENSSLVYELSDLLELSTDSVYRRLRGETSLSFEEIRILSKHYRVSIDMLNEFEPGSVSFTYSLLDNHRDFKSHWQSMLNDLIRINSSESKNIIYAAIDIPIFHHFNYPELMAFKMYYWLREVINDEEMMTKKFHPEILMQEIRQIAEDIYKTYCEIPSTEVWTEDTINSTTKQIQYYWDAGLFEDKDVAMLVCEQYYDELKKIEQQAETSSKDSAFGENYTFYQSEIEIGSNTVLVKMDDVNAVYMGFQTFNTIITSQSKFCRDTETWLDNLIRKSNQISSISQKLRYQFFKRQHDKISHMAEMIYNA
jgi:hypothetical protein